MGIDDYYHGYIGNEFFANLVNSPNGRYVVGAASSYHYSDADKEPDFNDRSPKSSWRKISASCSLKDSYDDEICFDVKLEDANRADVSDTGNVIVDGRCKARKPESIGNDLIAFNRLGEVVWVKEFDVWINNHAISANGQRVAVALNGPTGVLLINFSDGKVIWEHECRHKLTFRENSLMAILRTVDGSFQEFPFDENGCLSEYAQNLIDIDNYYVVLTRVENLFKATPTNVENIEFFLGALEGLENSMKNDWRAKYLRYKGELAEIKGDLAGAINFWENALELNQNVGIKKRLHQLKRLDT